MAMLNNHSIIPQKLINQPCLATPWHRGPRLAALGLAALALRLRGLGLLLRGRAYCAGWKWVNHSKPWLYTNNKCAKMCKAANTHAHSTQKKNNDKCFWVLWGLRWCNWWHVASLAGLISILEECMFLLYNNLNDTKWYEEIPLKSAFMHNSQWGQCFLFQTNPWGISMCRS